MFLIYTVSTVLSAMAFSVTLNTYAVGFQFATMCLYFDSAFGIVGLKDEQGFSHKGFPF